MPDVESHDDCSFKCEQSWKDRNLNRIRLESVVLFIMPEVLTRYPGLTLRSFEVPYSFTARSASQTGPLKSGKAVRWVRDVPHTSLSAIPERSPLGGAGRNPRRVATDPLHDVDAHREKILQEA